MNANQNRHAAAQERLCAIFNSANPVGTVCHYWTGVREGEGKVAATRTDARVLSGHTAVVWLEGVSGCVALSHVEPALFDVPPSIQITVNVDEAVQP